MANFIGSLVNVGIGKETVRGTAVAPTYWLPKSSLSVQDQAEGIEQTAPYGVIESIMDRDIGKLWAEGDLEMPIFDRSIGLILSSVFGATPSSANSEGSVYTHTFSGFTQSNTHQSLSFHRYDSNENKVFSNAMVNTFEISYVLGEYIKCTTNFMAKAGVTASSSATYSATEGTFRPQDVTIKFASNQAGLNAAQSVAVEEATLTFDKSLQEYQALGSTGLNEIFNGQVTVTGSMTLLWDNTTYKSLYTGATNQAIRFTIENTKSLIGTTLYPKLSFDIYKAQLEEWSLEEANDGIVKQTIAFKAMYSLSDTKSVTASLVNLATSY